MRIAAVLVAAIFAGSPSTAAAGRTVSGAAGPLAVGADARGGRSPANPANPAADARVRDLLIELRLPAALEPELADEPDPVVRATARIRLARARLTATDDPPRDRVAVIERLMRAHEDRLAGRGDDPRAVGWHLERAEDAWRWLRAAEGAQTRVLAGVPRPVDRQRLERAATAMGESVAAAGPLIQQLIAALEADPRWPDDVGLRREHRRLSGDERDRRLRTLEALALGLAVAVEEADAASGAEGSAGDRLRAPDELADRAVTAREALAALVARLEPAAAEAPPAGGVDATGITIAAARALLARAASIAGDEPAAADAWASARATAARAGDPVLAAVMDLESAVHAAEREAPAARVALAEALAEAIVAGTVAPELAPAIRPAVALATADAAFRLAAPAARGGADEAWTAGTLGWTHLAATDAGWRAVVLERFRLVLLPDDPPDALPPLAVFALAQRIDQAGGVPDESLVRRLATIADDAALAPEDRAEAAWRSGRVAAGRGEVLAAGRWMAEASEREPDDRRSHAMLDAALRLVAGAAVPGDVRGGADHEGAGHVPHPGGGVASADPAGPLLRLLEGRHAGTEGAVRWRITLAARLVRLGRPGAAIEALDRVRPALDDAAAAPSGAPPSDATGRGARSESAAWIAVRLDALESIVAAAGAAPVPDERLHDLIATLDAAVGWLDDGPPEVRDPEGLLAPRATGDRAAWRRTCAWLDLGAPVRAWDAAAAALEARRGTPAARTGDAQALLSAAGRALDGLGDDVRRREAAEALAASGSADAFDMLALRIGRSLAVDDADDGRPFDHAGRVIDLARAIEPLAGGAAVGFERSGWAARVRSDGASGASDAIRPAPVAAPDPATDRSARRLALALAEVDRRLGRHETAATWYTALGGLDASDPVVVFGAAECRFASGDETALAEAMPGYRRLAGNESATGRARWWVVQLRMLQTLDRVGRNLDRIAPRIERLRVRDADLGGPRTRAAFERLARRHSGGETAGG